jgi:hypothetical protein
MVLTGALLFFSQPLKCYNSLFFRIKMTLLLLAGVNALVFHLTMYRSMADWDQMPVPSLRARLAGWLSLALWVAIITAGRTMAYKF